MLRFLIACPRNVWASPDPRLPSLTESVPHSVRSGQAIRWAMQIGPMPKARRGRLHADFADWIEQHGGGRDEHAPLLAHHFAEAVRPEDVDVVWAGEQAQLAQTYVYHCHIVEHLSLPHRRTRRQRHDASVHRRAIGTCVFKRSD